MHRPRRLRAPDEGGGALRSGVVGDDAASREAVEAREQKGTAGKAILHKFHLSRGNALSLQAQLEAQVRYAIATGEVHPGDPLASINEMAKHLSVNRNTVHQVYQRLAAAGLLEIAHGLGVFVARNQPSATTPTSAVKALIRRTFAAAARLGVSPLTFGQVLQSQAATFEARFPLVAFVECNSYQANDFAGQIGECWGLHVAPVLLSRIKEAPDAIPNTCKLVVTSYFHYQEVRNLLQNRSLTIRPVVLDVLSDLKEKLRRVPRGTRVGVISRFEGVHEVALEIGNEVRRRQLNLRMFPFRGGASKGLKQFLEAVEWVICPDTARDAVAALPARNKPRIIEWKARLDLNEVDAIRRSAAFLPAF